MRRRGRTRTTRPMGRRTNLRPKSINLPGLGIEDIDLEEIGGIGRPPLVTSTFPPRSEDDRLPETINIPNVGRVQLPIPEMPDSSINFEGLGDRMRESDDVIYEVPENFELPTMSGNRGINPPLGKRADGSIIYLMDDDAFDILKSQEITETQPVETQPETKPTAPTPTGSYESSYIDWLESKPEKPTVRRLGRMPGGGPAYKRAQKQYREDLASWKASKPTRDSFTAPTPTPSPVDTQPVEIQPVEPEPTPPPPTPPSFEGFVPRNIIGASFDPKDVSAQQKMVADARARQTPGGYLTYDNPMLGNKQTQFDGYGQPMPTAPLMNYAGLSSPITYSTPAPDPDAQPGGPPPPPPVIVN